ncbi:C40 family peptidase [Aneurinibacillus sp. REN35]|uniref:C40 family peptidase n=1 Tax=Aneurinibacillus sp. REN35 TaxID=3237286 RepID=UPI003527B12F
MKRVSLHILSFCIGMMIVPAAAHATVSDTYTVQAGETLYSIAVKNGTTVQQLLHYNPDISSKDTLLVGQFLNLPHMLRQDIVLNTIQTAEALIGKTSFTDASFLHYILKQNGIYVNTTNTDTLLMKGEPVAQDDIQQGDIIFYRSTPEASSSLHTVLYIGDGKIIHAKEGYVRIDTIALADEVYYAPRRVIQ